MSRSGLSIGDHLYARLVWPMARNFNIFMPPPFFALLVVAGLLLGLICIKKHQRP